MFGTKTMSVGMIAVAFVALSGLASATSTPYFVPVGQTLDFTVAGTSASLQQVTGSAVIVGTMNLGGGLLKVTIHCNDDSAADCSGFILS